MLNFGRRVRHAPAMHPAGYAGSVGGNKQNVTLASLLAEVGWSPYDLARAVNKILDGSRRIHMTTTFSWRDKGVVPRGSLPSLVAGLLSEALGRTVDEHEIWPGLPSSSSVHKPSDYDLDGPWSCREGLRLFASRPTFSANTVRQHFAISGAELISVADRWRGAAAELLPERRNGSGVVNQELISYLESDVVALRRLDDGHGGSLVQQTSSHQLALATSLLVESQYSAEIGRALASVVAQLAQLTGWLNFDQGNHGEAQRSYLLALRAAALSADHALGAMILSALAAQQTWRQRPLDVVALIDIAVKGLAGRATPRVGAILAIRQARAFAAAGDECVATGQMRRAEQMLDRSGTDDVPIWAYCTGSIRLFCRAKSADAFSISAVLAMQGDIWRADWDYCPMHPRETVCFMA